MRTSTSSPKGIVLVITLGAAGYDGLVELIQDAGVPATSAPFGPDALEYLRLNAPPSLILLDLPVTDGFSRDLRHALCGDARLESVPVIGLCAGHIGTCQVGALKVDGCLHKPVDSRLLIEVVTSYCLEKSARKG